MVRKSTSILFVHGTDLSVHITTYSSGKVYLTTEEAMMLAEKIIKEKDALALSNHSDNFISFNEHVGEIENV